MLVPKKMSVLKKDVGPKKEFGWVLRFQVKNSGSLKGTRLWIVSGFWMETEYTANPAWLGPELSWGVAKDWLMDSLCFYDNKTIRHGQTMSYCYLDKMHRRLMVIWTTQ